MSTNVRNYTDEELISRMKSLPSFLFVPKGYHVIAVRSTENAKNVYDDKLYPFIGEVGISAMPCTTNSGSYGLKNFFKWNKKGTVVIKFDEVYYNSFMLSDGKKVRHHNGKVQCLRQIAPLKYYRDNNLDDTVDETGVIYEEIASTNIHPNSYNKKSGIISWVIGGWSTGCVVVNDLTKYWTVLIKKAIYNEPITFTGLKEF